MNVHVIRDIHYRRRDEPATNWIECSCRVFVDAPTPDLLALEYAAHRKAVKAVHQRPPRMKSQPIGRSVPAEQWSTW